MENHGQQITEKMVLVSHMLRNHRSQAPALHPWLQWGFEGLQVPKRDAAKAFSAKVFRVSAMKKQDKYGENVRKGLKIMGKPLKTMEFYHHFPDHLMAICPASPTSSAGSKPLLPMALGRLSWRALPSIRQAFLLWKSQKMRILINWNTIHNTTTRRYSTCFRRKQTHHQPKIIIFIMKLNPFLTLRFQAPESTKISSPNFTKHTGLIMLMKPSFTSSNMIDSSGRWGRISSEPRKTFSKYLRDKLDRMDRQEHAGSPMKIDMAWNSMFVKKTKQVTNRSQTGHFWYEKIS